MAACPGIDSPHSQAPLNGQVVAAFGRRSRVEVEPGIVLSCVARGRRSGIVCGDRVRLQRTAGGEGVIEAVEPRGCLLYRSDAKREKAIAANITQVVVVLAVAPAPNAEFIDRCLIAAEHAGARVLLVLNKVDLVDVEVRAARTTARYAALGCPMLHFSRERSIEPLLAELKGHLSVLIGASGVGKSTLVNRLVPEASARVGEISQGKEAGRHTTTRAQLYRIDANTALIDSPGMHAFGLSHLTADDLAHGFVELRALHGACRFRNCRHDGEPGCAVDQAARAGSVCAERLTSYRRILRSIG